MALSYERTIYTSPNGLSWTQRRTGGSNPLSSAAWNGNTWLAVGGRDWGYPTALTSPSGGTTWTVIDPGVSVNGFFSTAWNGALFSVVGVDGRVCTTTNGSVWQTQASLSSSDDLYAVSADQGRFAVAGERGFLAMSRNGADWAIQNSGVSAALRGITFGDRRVVAVGDNGTIVTAVFEPNADADAQPDWAEGLSGTDPLDPASYFQCNLFMDGAQRASVHWDSVEGRVYSVYWSPNLLSGFQCLESNIPWPRNSFTNASAAPSGFYKISVQLAP